MRPAAARASISAPVVVADEVEQAVHERRPPGFAHDLRAEHRVAELARQPGRQLLAPVDREGQHVGRLVDAEVLAFERAHLLRADERDAQLALVDALGRKHAPRELDSALVSISRPLRLSTSTVDHGYRLRCVPVSSACSL